MSQRLICHTLFDIQRTDVRGIYRVDFQPFRERQGQWITDRDTWNQARNRQRNFETLVQIISLRTLPENITDPTWDEQRRQWWFGFQVPDPASVAWGADPVGALRYDADRVPMITGLGEPGHIGAEIRSYGPDANVWFDIQHGK